MLHTARTPHQSQGHRDTDANKFHKLQHRCNYSGSSGEHCWKRQGHRACTCQMNKPLSAKRQHGAQGQSQTIQTALRHKRVQHIPRKFRDDRRHNGHKLIRSLVHGEEGHRCFDRKRLFLCVHRLTECPRRGLHRHGRGDNFVLRVGDASHFHCHELVIDGRDHFRANPLCIVLISVRGTRGYTLHFNGNPLIYLKRVGIAENTCTSTVQL